MIGSNLAASAIIKFNNWRDDVIDWLNDWVINEILS